MADIRRKTHSYTLGGKTYELEITYNVLADVEEWYGGNILRALSGPSHGKAALAFVAAAMNQCAEEKGWEERFTPRSLGRLIAPSDYIRFSQFAAELIGEAFPDPEPGTEAPEEAAEDADPEKKTDVRA